MRFKIFYLIAFFVFLAFGMRVVTYAERNFSPSNSIASFVKAKTEDATGSGSLSDSGPTSSAKTQANPLNGLRFSMLRVEVAQIFSDTKVKRLFLTLEILNSVDIHALRRPPRA